MAPHPDLLFPEHAVLDLSMGRNRHSLALREPSTSMTAGSWSSVHVSSGSDFDAFRRLSSPEHAEALGHRRDEEMTDEEQEQSLLQPLMNARLYGSRASPEEGQTTHADTLSLRQVPTLRNIPKTNVSIPEVKASQLHEVPPIKGTTLSASSFDREQARNYQARAQRRQRATQASYADDLSSKAAAILDKVSNWSKYTKRDYQRVPAHRSPRRTPVRSRSKRKDFSTKKEINKFGESGNFIFHRGFSLRQAPSRLAPPRFRNPKEFSSFMEYLQMDRIPYSDITNSNRISVPQIAKPECVQLLRVQPRLTRHFYQVKSTSKRIPLSCQSNNVRHRNSIRRSGPVTRRTRTIRRTKSLPTTRLASRMKMENKDLRDVWRRYLMVVALQRIQLRLRLLSSPSFTDSDVSSSGNSIQSSHVPVLAPLSLEKLSSLASSFSKSKRNVSLSSRSTSKNARTSFDELNMSKERELKLT
ncbi:LAMI_0C10374g1_1 [Lachancea mirantina]|uniref:LAMI_0C10374g1_1 n=1 Tax=Lachancea mirantina TaxID=1230905 RepID=A0A1G4J5R9_9SACH|nr:LAMI_0C10374g1_1 [Lachancea mirantina]